MKRIAYFFAALLVVLCLLASLTGCVKIEGETIPSGTTELDLNGRGLTDVSQLSGLKKLEKLDLRGNYITAQQFDALSEALPDCEIIWSVPIGVEYFDSDISELSVAADYVEDLYNLRYFTNLAECDVSGTHADDERLYEVAQSVPEINIYWTTDIGTGEISTNAEEIDLSKTKLNDITALKYFTNLRTLKLYRAATDDISFLEGLTKLEVLVLDNNQITDLSPLAGLTNLRELSLKSVYTDEQYDLSFMENLRELESLDLSACFAENYDFVSKLPKLRYLNLEHDLSTGDDKSFLADLPSTLEELVLDSCELRNDDLSLINDLSSLKKLNLKYNYFTDLSPLQKLSGLEELTLTEYELTAAQLPALKKAMPNCTITVK